MIIFNFDLYSFVIKIAVEVSRAVLDEIMIPTLGLTIDKVVVVTVEIPPNKTSETINFTFFCLIFHTSF